MGKILLIAYSFPPLIDAQSFRWYYLSRELSKRHEITVVTIKMPEQGITYHYPKNMKIHRIFPGPFEGFFHKVKAGLKVAGQDNKAIREKLWFRYNKKAYHLIRNIFNNILIPDLRTEWLLPAYYFLSRKISLGDYDVLITSHEPGVDAILGLLLKRKNKTIHWIGDFGDPFVAPYTPRWRMSIDRVLEQKIYDQCDTLLFTSEKTVKYILETYPGLGNKKILVIRQGFDQEAQEGPAADRNPAFTFCYTGTFYRDFRNPSHLIAALQNLDFPFQFVIAGRNEGFYPDFSALGNQVKFSGLLSNQEAIDLQKKSDLLIHMTNKDSLQVPGKVFEYLGSKRPILCVSQNEDDESSELIKKLNAGVVVENKPDDLKRALNELYLLWKSGEIGQKYSVNAQELDKFSWHSQAEKLHEHIEETR